MKRVKQDIGKLFVLSLFILLSSSAFGQDSIVTMGKYALQFQVSQDLTLGSFLGTVISGKYHMSGKNAIRIGVSYSTSMSNTSATGVSSPTDYYDQVSQRYQTNIDIIAQYLYYPTGVGEFFMYCGIGPRLGGNFYDSFVISNSPNGQSGWTDYHNGWSAGLIGTLGVEWAFFDQMSLTGEYGISYLYSYTKGGASRQYKSFIENRYTLNGNDVRFGLSIYF